MADARVAPQTIVAATLDTCAPWRSRFHLQVARRLRWRQVRTRAITRAPTTLRRPRSSLSLFSLNSTMSAVFADLKAATRKAAATVRLLLPPTIPPRGRGADLLPCSFGLCSFARVSFQALRVGSPRLRIARLRPPLFSRPSCPGSRAPRPALAGAVLAFPYPLGPHAPSVIGTGRSPSPCAVKLSV